MFKSREKYVCILNILGCFFNELGYKKVGQYQIINDIIIYLEQVLSEYSNALQIYRILLKT